MLERAFRPLLLGLLTSVALATAAITLPVIPGAVQPACAQVSAEFQEALEPYGHWARSARWGEVWVPDELPPDWRPYQYGHWVYTDDWGWYWISDPEEEDWGWVVFHYGRWAFERALGWFWIPDDEWAPAWVDWRYGGDYVGWAPLPPDEIIEEYDDNPTYWMFVSPRFLTHPRWRTYMLPQSRRAGVFGRTRVVNRSVGYGRGRAAVNPGISPAFVARASRAPVATFRVSPRVLAGTQGVSGAVRVTPQQLQAGRGGGQRGRRPSASGANAVTVQRTSAVALPVGPAAAPQPLGRGERGRLGTHPPRAAQGAPPPQRQQPPAQPQQQQPQAQPQPQQQAPQQAPQRRQQLAPPLQQQQQSPPQQQPQQATPPAPQQSAPPPTPPPAQAPVQRREPPPQPPAQRREPPPGAPPPPVDRRERPPEPQQHAPSPGAPPAAAPPRPVAPQTPPPPAVRRPEPPHPPPPAAVRPDRPPPPPEQRRPPPPPQQQQQLRHEPPPARPAPPPAAAKPAPPPPPAAKPAPKPEEKKDEPPK